MLTMKNLRFVMALVLGWMFFFSLIQGFFLRFALVLPSMVVSLIGLWLCLRWENFVRIWTNLRGHLLGKIMTNAVVASIAIAMLVCIVVSGFMIGAIQLEVPTDDATVIVLGAQVIGDHPSNALQRRLEVAFEHLESNPETVAVLAGGLGNTAYISEAEAMRRWLTANGICDSRLFLEEYSTSTYENIAFSRSIIEENNLSPNVAIATDSFHMFRAQHLATNAELNPSAITARTPLIVLPFFWLREIAAILVGILR